MRLTQRVFRDIDQEVFADFSGDRNPIHVDPTHARKTQAGARVVHGIHMLLWSLDSFAASQSDLPPLKSLRAKFTNFTYIGERVDLMLVRSEYDGIHLQALQGNLVRARVTARFGQEIYEHPQRLVLPSTPVVVVPAEVTLEEIRDQSGRVPIPARQKDAAALFPALTSWIGPSRVCSLAATSYLVGMICPGMHSIYGEVLLRVCEPGPEPDALDYRVIEADSRFRAVEQEVTGGGWTGTVGSFARIPPIQQASIDHLAGRVGRDEFRGSVALIAGGSRGLGELTAKVIAAGGGRVVLTWHTGKDEAERVTAEIRAAGAECEMLQYDALKPAAEQLDSLSATPTHAYYFATPPIYRPQAEVYNPERFKLFLDVYVDGFWQFAQALLIKQPKLAIFYPSTVFVVERSKGMTEYAMAKAAGELLCANLNASSGTARATCVRLPRLLTDQTASVQDQGPAPALDTMIPIIREVQSWPILAQSTASRA